MNTIALETSIQPGSIALLDDDVTVYSSAFPPNRRTTQSFAPQLDEGLKAVGWNPTDVDLFVVCQGPGSFTGLRIGVTAGKTFAYATGCQLLALDTLDVIARNAPRDGGDHLWVVMDAQRQQLYVAEFRRDEGVMTRCSDTRIVDGALWVRSLMAEWAVMGPGLKKWRDQLPAGQRVVDAACWNPTAEALAHLGRLRFNAGQRQDCWRVSPAYYRPSAAEEKWKQRRPS